MTLDFPSSDFPVHASFPLSLSDTSPTMPFQVLSTKKGGSRWTQMRLPPDQGLYYVWDAALADSSLNLTPNQAITRAYDYVRAWVGNPNLVPALDGAATYHALTADNRACVSRLGEVTSVQQLFDTINVNYSCGKSVWALLQAQPAGSSQPPLSPATLASDPRIPLNPTPASGINDPPNKTAIIIAPFTATGDPSTQMHILVSARASRRSPARGSRRS